MDVASPATRLIIPDGRGQGNLFLVNNCQRCNLQRGQTFRGGTTLRSEAVWVTIRKPGKGDPEQPAVARIHHTPWSNYETSAFCGDTFDTVQRWPVSKLAKYCHYWNGRHLQFKKDYAKAEASYRLVVDKYPDFALADHAGYGLVECLCAQKKFAAARKVNAELRKRVEKRAAGRCAVQRLVQAMSEHIPSEVARPE
jgi:TolA-binding protein